MKKKKIVIILFMALICTIVGFTFISFKKSEKKGMVGILFPKENQSTIECMESYIQEDGRSIEVDGYIFTLVRTLYDYNVGTGCFQMEVKKVDGSIPKVEYIDPMYGEIEVDRRFEIRVYDYEKLKCKENNNEATLYVYCSGMEYFDHKIEIYDYDGYEDNMDEPLVGEICMIDSKCSVQFGESDGTNIYVSPFCIKEKNYERKELFINKNNGKTSWYIKDGEFVEKNLRAISSYGAGTNLNTYYWPKKLINIKKIKEVGVNGIVLEKVK